MTGATVNTKRTLLTLAAVTLTGCAQVTYPELDGSGMAIRVEGNDGEVGAWSCVEEDLYIYRSRCDIGPPTDEVYAICSRHVNVPGVGFSVEAEEDLVGRWRFSSDAADIELVGNVDNFTGEGGTARGTEPDDFQRGRISARGWARTDDLTVTVVADFALPPADDCTPDDFE